METKINIGSNTVFNTIKSFLGIIYPLITFPYIARVLMAENVGKINFGNSIVSYFALIASLGVTAYAIRECSKVRDDKQKLEKVASQILSINLFSTALAYFALFLTLVVAKPLVNYRALICMQSLIILFTAIGADWINTAMEDFKFIAMRTIGMQVVSLLLMFAFVHKPEDYILFAVISVVASSGANIINVFYRRKFCKIKFTLNMDLKRHLPPIMLMFSIMLSQTIYCNSDMTMLGLFKGDFEVGLYSTSVKIYNIINTIVASVAWVVMPQLSENFAKKNYQEINKLLKYSLNYIIVIGLPCFVGMNILTKPLLSTIAGVEYLGATASLRILSIALLCSFVGGWIGNMMMLPSGREKICFVSGIVSALLNIALNFVLIPKFGLNAAAFTTALSEFVGIVILKAYVEKEIKIDGFFEMIKAPLVGAVAIVVIGYIVQAVIVSPCIITLVTFSLSVVVYIIVLAVFKNEFFIGIVKPILNNLKGWI